MTLTDTGANLALRQAAGQLLGIAAGFAIQSIALCAGLGMILLRWPELHGVLQGMAAGCVMYLGWQMLRGRGAMAGAAGDPVPFWEAAARQFLNPRAWLICATAAMLCLPVALEPVLMAGYTGAI
jgi:threonine/homoserine/homoserine lactone efflux protein